MSTLYDTRSVSDMRIGADALRSKRHALDAIADAWDALHAGTCSAGKGHTRLDAIRSLSADELRCRFFAPAERDTSGHWLYRPDVSQLIRI